MDHHHLPALDVPLERLAALGLPRPPSCTVRRYLGAAVAEGVLPAPVVERYLAVVDEAEHSPRGAVPRAVERVAGELLAAVEAVEPADARLAAVRRRLEPATRLPAPRRRATVDDRVNRLSPEPAPDDEEEEGPAPAAGTSLAVRRRRLWIAAAMAWTLVAAVLGHLAGDPLWDLARAGASRVLGWRVGDPQRLERLQQLAGSRPEDAGVWRALVAEARRLDRWEHVILGLERRVGLEPDNATLLNELAWLRLTIDERWLRDPERALELAERAYALDPAPNIADTLAEAAYQTGDPERAVALEEAAIAKVRGNDEFYRRQLEKFREAVRAQAPTP